MRLADADLLPYDFTDFADTIHRYVDELQKLLKTKQDEIVERNKEHRRGRFHAPSPIRKKTSVPPPAEEVPPHLNFAPLAERVGRAHSQRGALPEGAGESQQQRRTGGEPGRTAGAQRRS